MNFSDCTQIECLLLNKVIKGEIFKFQDYHCITNFYLSLIVLHFKNQIMGMGVVWRGSMGKKSDIYNNFNNKDELLKSNKNKIDYMFYLEG